MRALHSVALRLGMTVEEAQQRLTGREFAAWLAYFTLQHEDASGETKKKADMESMGFVLED